jgi:hypothetical protein
MVLGIGESLFLGWIWVIRNRSSFIQVLKWLDCLKGVVMGADSHFFSVPRGADHYQAYRISRDMLRGFGLNAAVHMHPSSQGIIVTKPYEFSTYVEEESFYGRCYWWLDKYFNTRLSDRESTIEEGVRITKEDLEVLIIELDKTIDSADVEVIFNKEKRFPEYHVRNSAGVYLGLIEDGILDNDEDIHWVLNVWHFVNRTLKEFPWEDRDMYYRLS